VRFDEAAVLFLREAYRCLLTRLVDLNAGAYVAVIHNAAIYLTAYIEELANRSGDKLDEGPADQGAYDAE
jgi:hypothetical protein